jgi:hypothetical protein
MTTWKMSWQNVIFSVWCHCLKSLNSWRLAAMCIYYNNYVCEWKFAVFRQIIQNIENTEHYVIVASACAHAFSLSFLLDPSLSQVGHNFCKAEVYFPHFCQETEPWMIYVRQSGGLHISAASGKLSTLPPAKFQWWKQEPSPDIGSNEKCIKLKGGTVMHI